MSAKLDVERVIMLELEVPKDGLEISITCCLVRSMLLRKGKDSTTDEHALKCSRHGL